MAVSAPADLIREVVMRRSCFLASAVSILCASCAVGPDFEQPAPKLPERWEQPATPIGAAAIDADVLTGDWWTALGDARLNELIERARNHNLDLRLATLRVAASRAQRAIAAGERWPGIAANGVYRRERQSEHGINTRLIEIVAPPGADRDRIIQALAEPFGLYQAGFDASWELDLWGRVRRIVESTDASFAASREDLHDAELTVIAEVARLYFELAGVRDQLRIAREDVAAGIDQVELTRHRTEGGLVTSLELSVQQAQLANSRALIPALEHQEAVLQNALALLVGEPPRALNELLRENPSMPAVPTIASAGIPSELARRRPDIRRAEARLQAATAEIGIAVADLYPRFSLTGSFVHQSLDASDFTEWGARQWTVGPTLSLPLFQGGRLRSVVELRKLQQQQAAVDYQRTVLAAWHEVENTLDAFISEQRRNSELAELVRASREAYDIAHIRYEHGLVDYLVDLDARRTLLQAQRAYSESTTQLGVRFIALCKALGGGWGSGDS